MSQNIEQRVVDMQFQNEKFENGVKESLGSLESLKKGLDFKDAGRGFSDLGKTANSLSFSRMADGVDSLAFRFSWLGEQIRNVQNGITGFAKNIINELTLGGLKGGFAEYNLLIDSTQTIFSNASRKGSTLDDINASLDELNNYADLTIYNFANMTDAIGKFTAAGVGLDESVTSIKGMANMAAYFGADPQQLSNAMIQVSKGLARGSLKMLDWRSMTVANMGGEAIQDLLVQVASKTNKKNKNLAKQVDKKGFEYTLKSGWLTDEVFATAMSIFGNEIDDEKLKAMKFTDAEIAEFHKLGESAQEAATKIKTLPQLLDTFKEKIGSSWTRSWLLVVGDLDEAKELWGKFDTVFGGMIDESGANREKMLQEWRDLGGRQFLLNGIDFALKAITDTVNILKDAWQHVFPKKTGKDLVAMTRKFTDFTKAVAKFIKDNKTNITNVFKGVFSILAIGKNIVLALWNGLVKLVKAFIPENFDFMGWIGGIGEWIDNLRQAIEVTDVFNRAVDWIGRTFKDAWEEFKKTEFYKKLVEALQPIIDKFNEWKTAVTEFFEALSNPDGSGIEQLITDIKGWWEGLFASPEEVEEQEEGVEKQVTMLEKIKEALKGLSDTLSPILDPIKKAIKSLMATIFGEGKGEEGEETPAPDKGKKFSFWKLFLAGGAVFLVGKAVFGIAGFIKKFKKVILNIPKAIQGTIESIGGMFENIGEAAKIKAQTEKIKAIAAAILMIVAAVWILSTIEVSKLLISIGAIIILMAAIVGLFWALDYVADKTKATGRKMVGMAAAIMSIGITLLLLTTSILILGNMKLEKMLQGALGIALILGIIAGYAHIMPKEKTLTKIKGIALPLIGIAIAMRILGGMTLEKTIQSVSAIGLILMMVAGFANIMPDDKSLVKIKGIALPLIGIALALRILGTMNLSQIINSVAAIGVILVMIAGFANMMPKQKALSGLIGVGMALLLVAGSLVALSFIKPESLLAGVTALGAALLIIAMFMQSINGISAQSFGTMMGLAGAIGGLVGALKVFSDMNADQLKSALIGFGGAMLILALGATVLENINLSASTAGNLGLLALAIGLFIPILQAMGSLKFGETIEGLLTLAVAITGLALTAQLVKLFTPAFKALARTIVTLGAGILLAGAGVYILSAAFAGLALIGAKTITELMGLIPQFFKSIAQGIVEFLGIFTASAPALKDAIVAFIKAGVQSITETAGVLADALFTLIIESLTRLKTNIPQIGNLIFDIIIGALDVLIERMPELLTKLAKVIGAMLTGAVQLVGEFKVQNIGAVVKAMGGMIALFAVLAKVGRLAKGSLLSILTLTLSMALIAGMLYLLSTIPINTILPIMAGLSLVMATITGMMIAMTFIPAPAALSAIASLAIGVGGLTAILAIMGGLSSIPGFDWLIGKGAELLKTVGTAIGGFLGGIIGGIAEGATSVLPTIGTHLSDFTTNAKPFLKAMSSTGETAFSNIEKLAGAILALTAANLLDQVTKWLGGGDAITSFGNSLGTLGPALAQFGIDTKDIDSDAIDAASNAASVLAALTVTIPKENGALDWIMGSTAAGMKKFADNLEPLGKGMKKYSAAVAGTSDAITASENAAKMLVSLAVDLPKTDGALQWLLGAPDLGKFGGTLEDFGGGMKAYAGAVKGLKWSDTLASETAAKMLIALQKELDPTDGKLAKLMGEKDLGNFGTRIKTFGEGLKSYHENVTGITFDENADTGPVAIGKALNAFEKELSPTGGLANWFTGEHNIGIFGDKIKNFAESISMLSKNSEGANLVRLTAVGTTLQSLLDLAENATKLGAADNIYTLTDAIDGFIFALAESITKNNETLTEAGKTSGAVIGTGMIDGIMNGSEEGGGVATMASSFVKTFKETFDLPANLLLAKTAGTTMGGQALIGLATGFDSMTDYGKSYLTNFETGLKDETYLAKIATAATTAKDKVITEFNAGKALAAVAGFNVLIGWYEGLGDSTMVKKIIQRAFDLGKDTIAALKRGSDQASPSKAARKAGRNVDEGYLLGIDDLSGEVYDTSYQVGKSSVTAIQDAVDKMSMVINTDLDNTPVIRPVLDLSDVTKNASRLGDLLDPGVVTLATNTSRDISSAANAKQAPASGSPASVTQIFQQTNNSPKALSRLEIYRQTKNQFAAAKGLVNQI